MGQSNNPSENYLFLNVMVNFVIVNQILTGSALHIEKNQTIIMIAGIVSITKICLCNIQRFFSAVKVENFIKEKFDSFNIFAQNIDCGYML